MRWRVLEAGKISVESLVRAWCRSREVSGEVWRKVDCCRKKLREEGVGRILRIRSERTSA